MRIISPLMTWTYRMATVIQRVRETYSFQPARIARSKCGASLSYSHASFSKVLTVSLLSQAIVSLDATMSSASTQPP